MSVLRQISAVYSHFTVATLFSRLLHIGTYIYICMCVCFLFLFFVVEVRSQADLFLNNISTRPFGLLFFA